MYARLYWAYALLEGDDVDIFTEGMANWPRMSEGFEFRLKKYPESDYLMNGYAYMACRAGDSERYQALNAKLKDRLSSTAWSAHYSPGECEKKFAGTEDRVRMASRPRRGDFTGAADTLRLNPRP
jgi:hypothetical protein